jgi:hypothetical protein
MRQRGSRCSCLNLDLFFGGNYHHTFLFVTAGYGQVRDLTGNIFTCTGKSHCSNVCDTRGIVGRLYFWAKGKYGVQGERLSF